MHKGYHRHRLLHAASMSREQFLPGLAPSLAHQAKTTDDLQQSVPKPTPSGSGDAHVRVARPPLIPTFATCGSRPFGEAILVCCDVDSSTASQNPENGSRRAAVCGTFPGQWGPR
ncbi:hypothetical protein GGTG_11188 [Gaeumannomyces tritici R3-111a-1]|uniref:Uncharacterized protein n=1 Tax=Gaeumannomyces tritici (strain R3-111a-1) TaxID=644352 RepID=J3PCG6_GAET3|nr:hypothetical protein GGTG_11188 [Gaeumannomyces tritici R3-111a-1]EJT71936.1 hypothetical protein GGTG_11188 [Gaeumannomyces tritici R3-111a-1]